MFGLGRAPLASTISTPRLLLARKPTTLSFEEAATLPATWATVHVTLERAVFSARKRLLLQAAAGGVGLSAVEYVNVLGGNIVGTAGRPCKHRQLRMLELGELCSSRQGSAFAVGSARLLDRRRARLVLNSLSIDFISVSFASLDEVGGFVELGKLGVWSRQLYGASAPRIAFHVIALDTDVEQDAAWMHGLLTQLSARAQAGVVSPLPMRSFDMETQAVLAFRTLQAGLNTGKIVVRIAARVEERLRSGGSHAVSGGTAGLGLLTARWLAQRGAQGLALASRSGNVASGADWEQLNATGAATLVVPCDTAETVDLLRLVAMMRAQLPPMRGVWHAAGVLADALLPKQTAESMCRVYAPKAHGAWELQHICSAVELRMCALFSSVAALLGGVGQANYSAASSCLDALAACRRAHGQTAASVQWGSASGYARNLAPSSQFAADPISLAQCIEGLQFVARPIHPYLYCVLAESVVTGVVAAPYLLSFFAPKATGDSAPGCAVSTEAVLAMVKNIAGGAVKLDEPLMEVRGA